MRSYRPYIGGEDVDGKNWIYCVKAAEFLDDARKAFALKREFELGRLPFAGDGDGDDDDRVSGRCQQSTAEQNQAALAAAATAKRPWGRTPLALRHELGTRFHQRVLDHYAEFVDILVGEGHPRRLAAWEIGGVLQGTSPRTLEWYFEQMCREYQYASRRMKLVRKPDGVVCLNPPANASASNAALGIAALMAGNTLVVKAPRTSPLGVFFLFREIIAPVLDELGAPPGTMNVICGNAQNVLRQWIDSPLVDDIMFFGDSAVGLQFGRDCVLRGKKPILELAGNDGCVVWRDADLDRAVEAICESFYGSGQICMVPKWVIVHPAVADDLLGRLTAAARAIRPGYPDDPDVLLSPVLKADKFFDFLAEAKQSGQVLTGGRRVDVNGQQVPDGAFVEPTVVRVDGLDRAASLHCVREETFFPLLPVVVPEPAADDELAEMIIEALNGNDYGLRNSLWCRDETVTEAFCTGVVNGGMLKVNDSHIGFVPVLGTHGGTGRTGGPFGELNYPILRTSHLQGISVGRDVSPREAVFSMSEVTVPAADRRGTGQ